VDGELGRWLTGVRRYLLDAAGPARTPRANRHLAILLALIAGMLNSVGFVAVSVYTSHMTGLLASVADHAVLGSWDVVRVGAAAITAFTVGAACCALLFNWGRRRAMRSRFANVLVLEAVLVLIFGALADRLTWSHRAWVYITVLGFTMGLQNAIITKISQSQIRTTHVTGMITDIGIELGKLAYRSRLSDVEPVRADLGKLGTLTAIVLSFFGGSALGAWGYAQLGFRVLLAPALLLLVAAAPPLLADARRSLRPARGAPSELVE
jgi:uncharacterized membrane protein YoaK (UPF0700 family)